MTATDLCANTSKKMKANVNNTTLPISSSTRVHAYMGTHCKSPTEWTNRIPKESKYTLESTDTHYSSVFSG